MNTPGSGRGNPWNQGRPQSQQLNKKKRPGVPNFSVLPNSAEVKFREAQTRLQASVQKHIQQDYESSSDEGEVESENILGSVLKSYSLLGGKSEDLGRTQNFLEDAFQSGAATCLICIASVKRNDAIWSCSSCFGFFHLLCIQRWAKDSIAHQKMATEEQPRGQHQSPIHWACPKCRKEHEPSSVPQRYYCFCGRTEDPAYQPWQVPHSCGDTCNKPLQPLCGHACLLLCHPGPCPPCPKMVTCSCYCGGGGSKPVRCSAKDWSCSKTCGHLMSCGRHRCSQCCHPDACPPCPRTSLQPCVCGGETALRQCAAPIWTCQQVCKKALECGSHRCELVCHSGACGPCPGTLARPCPCGKMAVQLPCTLDPPTCGDTCGRTLECGAHTCSRQCHKDKCGTCFERVEKACRCKLHTKEVPCQKEFTCETKCKRTKDCLRHPCNRKCCDGDCPPCEKPCGRTLTCSNHKCSSMCHRGPCYPCPLTVEVSCRCAATAITVPCGRQKRTRPPRCLKQCRVPPDCHHLEREKHRCHFGSCPPCRQPCSIQRTDCPHVCVAPCHSAVLVNTNSQFKPAGPWEKVAAQFELVALPCAPCPEPLDVVCPGGHESVTRPCHAAKSLPCGRPCGQPLPCTNHVCSLLCHARLNGGSCESCEEGCGAPRPEGCTHPCPKGCHPTPCPPCAATVKLRCHCALNYVFIRCAQWTAPDKPAQLLCCGNQCPKNYDCGHRCLSVCHPGICPALEQCKKKVKVSCACRRIKKEFQCATVTLGQASVPCEQTCLALIAQEAKKHELEVAERMRIEEMKNKEELEMFEKKMQGRKRRDRRMVNHTDKPSIFVRHKMGFMAALGVALALLATSLLLHCQ